MRRIIIILTALAVLAGATAAYAAVSNNYAGSSLTFGKGKGTKAKPKAIAFTETLNAANSNPSLAAYVLTDIKVKIYGLVSNAKRFPTCSNTEMVTKKSDSFCPDKSKFATGSVNALLGGPTFALGITAKCNPGLDVFHAGGNKLWFFFTTDATHQCGSLHTGDTDPYPGTVKQQGKYLLTDVPLPPDVSTRVAGHTGVYGSLIHQVLNWRKMTTKVKGKTYAAIASVGCQKGKRPWTITYTATNGTSTLAPQTVSGSSKC